MAELNVFKVNPLVPDKKVALVKNFGAAGAVTMWFGWIVQMPEDQFANADEAHVSQWTYDRIAARAEATGKGKPHEPTPAPKN